MQVEFRRSFKKDLVKIKDRNVLSRIQNVIEEIQEAENLNQVSQLKKLRGESNYYRIRVGSYRVGIKVGEGVVLFIRILHRKEIYRYFP
ncbi:plasmid stabilization protein [Phormidium willei BDU 130791]|nr:plasmid stabilization protein [Phormidium willei BDU 130791]